MGLGSFSRTWRIVMFSFSRRTLLAIASAVVVIASAQLMVPSESPAKDGGLSGVEGTLVAVDLTAGTLTVRTRRMQDVVIATNANTKIERNERRPSLAMLQLSDFVEAKIASGTTNVAVKIEATAP